MPITTRSGRSLVKFLSNDNGQFSSRLQLSNSPPSPPSARRLPPELVSIIFMLLIIEAGTPVIDASMKARNLLLVVSHVCTYWRRVVISNAALWCSFHVVVSERISKRSGERIESLIRLWLKYSGSCDLTIGYTILGTYKRRRALASTSASALRSIFSLLIPDCPRWQHLRLDVSPRAFEPLFRDSPLRLNLVLSRLKTFTLTLTPSEPDMGYQFEDPFEFSSAPLLCAISLIHMHFHPFGYRIPWSQLEKLELVGSNQELLVEEWLIMLQDCVNLTDCTVTLFSVPEDIPPMSLFTTRLLSLCITSSHTSLRHVYQTVRCPEMTCLAIEYNFEEDPERFDSQAGFISFVEGSPLLQSLALRELLISAHQLIDMLGRLELLHVLCLKEQPPMNWSFMQLIRVDWNRGKGYFFLH
jgi:F-box-like